MDDDSPAKATKNPTSRRGRKTAKVASVVKTPKTPVNVETEDVIMADEDTKESKEAGVKPVDEDTKESKEASVNPVDEDTKESKDAEPQVCNDELVPVDGDYTVDTIQNLREIGQLEFAENDEHSLSTFLTNIPSSKYDAFLTSIFKVSQPYFVAPVSLEESEWDALNVQVVRLVSTIIARFCDVAINWADVSTVADFPKSFIQTADLLREVCLKVIDKTTSKNILNVLERLCHPSLRLKQFYGTMSLNLVNRALEEKATTADVTRLYKLKHMLDFIDWDDRASLMMRGQLARCFLRPSFLKGDGINFLAHLHLVHHSFPLEIYEVLVNWVPHVRPAQNKVYSQILYKAWVKAEGEQREALQHIIQKWMMLAIFVTPKEAVKVRYVLSEFHHKRHNEGVSTMLSECYSPILWRYLHVANWQVRLNCVTLLMNSFPLVSTLLNLQQYEQEMEKAYKAIRNALLDQKDEVRKVAINGACRVLSTYWELVPPEQSAEMFTSMINLCSKDKHVAQVRIAVCDGMRILLQGNPLTHNALKLLLPKISHLLHDKVPAVRYAFFKVLEAVHKDGQMPVVDIVPYEHLLLRLAAEYNECKSCPLEQRTASSLAKRLAMMIIPGLMDHPLDGQLSRTVHAAEQYPLPLIALFTFADVGINPAARLSAALFQCCLRNEVQPMWPIIIGILLGKVANASPDVDNFLQRNITDEAFVKLIEDNPDHIEEFSHVALALPSSLTESCNRLLESDKLMTSTQLLLLCAKVHGFAKYIKPQLVSLIDDVIERLNGSTPCDDTFPSIDQNRFCRWLINISEVRELMLEDDNLKARLVNLCLRALEAVEASRPLSVAVTKFVGFALHMVLHWDLLQKDRSLRVHVELAIAMSKIDTTPGESNPAMRFLGMEVMQICGIAHGTASVTAYHHLIRELGERVWNWSGDDAAKCSAWSFLSRVWGKQVGVIHEIFENLGHLFYKVSDNYPKEEVLHLFFMYLFMKFQNSHLLESFFEVHRKDDKFVWHPNLTAAVLHVAPRFKGVKRYLQEYGLMTQSVDKKPREVADVDANRIFLDEMPTNESKKVPQPSPMLEEGDTMGDVDMAQTASISKSKTPTQEPVRNSSMEREMTQEPTQEVPDVEMTQTQRVPDTALSPTQRMLDTALSPTRTLPDTALSPTRTLPDTALTPMRTMPDTALTPTQRMPDTALTPTQRMPDTAQSPVYTPTQGDD